MAITVPAKQGTIHDIVKTWQGLKNLAYMFKRVEPINNARSTNEPPLFPQAIIGLRAAAEVPNLSDVDLKAYIDKVEAVGKRYIWASEASSSMMLWPFDQGLAFVADLMQVSYDEASNTITLEVDVVDKPATITEFEPHEHQTLDVHAAHYHFYTRPEVAIDASALLKSLKASDHKVKGLHVFAKGYIQFCWHVTMSASPSTPVPVGSQVNVSITDIKWDCDACQYNICNGEGGNITLTDSEVVVTLGVNGPGWIVAVSGTNVGRASFVKQTVDALAVDGTAWVVVAVGDASDIVVSVDSIYTPNTGSNVPIEQNAITLQGLPAPPPIPSTPPVAKLLLHPSKAYRRVHDRITLTVKALDTAGLPVANATVSVSAFGDCEPTSSTAVGTTDVTGLFRVNFESDKPGAVALVAAAVNAQGVAVTSEHI